MNQPNNSGSDRLIKRSYALLKSGEKDKARVYAQKAAKLSPDNEQAWLILASLSKSDQALYYLENALRANPESEAAKKGIRVIFEQMAAEGKSSEISSEHLSETFERKEPAIKVDDTSPIPVKHKSKFGINKSAEDETSPKSKGKIHSEKAAARTSIKKKIQKARDSKSEILPSVSFFTEEKKENLRMKLAKHPQADNQLPIEPKTAEQSIKKVRKVRIKKKKAKENIASVETSPPEIKTTEEKPQPIVQKIRGQTSADSVDLTISSEKEPPTISAESKTAREISQPIPKKTRGKTSADSIDMVIPSDEIPESTLEENLERVFTKKEAGEPIQSEPADDIVQPKAEIAMESMTPKQTIKPEPKKATLPPSKKITGKQKTERKRKKKVTIAAGDIDIIELILVSIGAIMLPLLVFLYFFLKN